MIEKLRHQKKTNILLCGGGSGGHVVPLLVIAEELDKKIPTELDLKIYCDKKVKKMVVEIFTTRPNTKIEQVWSGKFRRYHHLKWWQHLQLSIFLPNLIDFFKFLVGLCQSFFKLLIWRPKIIFVKGGYVCLPIGLAAKLLGIKIIIHDSDILPGLTNRILSRFARVITTGFPLDNYPAYKNKNAEYVGIPVKSSFQPIDLSQKQALRQELKLSKTERVVVVLGGGLGARVLNEAVINTAPLLPNTKFVLACGQLDYESVKSKLELEGITNVIFSGFFANIDKYILSSDVVVGRAGATTIAELAASRKLAIIVPNPRLSGGHQLKNAKYLAKKQAIDLLFEDELTKSKDALAKKITSLFNRDLQEKERQLDNFMSLSKADAASRLADIIIEEVF